MERLFFQYANLRLIFSVTSSQLAFALRKLLREGLGTSWEYLGKKRKIIDSK